MSSLVELVFEAVGVQPTADAVKKVTAAIDENARALARQGIVGTAMAQAEAELIRLQDAETKSLRAQWVARIEAAGAQVLATRAQNAQIAAAEASVAAQDKQISSLVALAAATLAARAVYQGFRDTIGNAAELQQLSLRTGETVRDLVIEEQAFRNAGLGANFLGTAANLLERALSPTAANAKRNAEIFRQLGISMPELRTMSFREQLETLSVAFAKLPSQAERAQLAMQLFGRFSGGQMLQLFSDPQAFARAEQQAGGLADQMERNAAAFLHLQQDMNGVKTQIESMFVATSEQLLPALEGVAKVLEGISGQSLGTIFGTAGLAGAGGVAAMLALPKLEMGLAKAAGAFQSEMLLVMSNMTGKLAQFLPIGLAAVIAEQIIFGVIQAYEDAQIQAIVNQSRGVHDAVDPFRKGFSSATTAEAMQQNLLASQLELARLINERNDLQGRGSVRHVNAKTGASTFTSNLSSDEAKRLDELNLAIPKLAADIGNKFGNASAVAKQLIDNQAAAFTANAATLVAQLPQLQEKHDKDAFARMTPEQQVADIGTRRSGINAQLAAIPAGASDDAKKATRLSLENELLELQKQQEEAEKRIAEAQKKIAEAAKKAADEEQKRQIYALETQRELALAADDKEQAQTLKEQIEQKRAIYSLSGLDLDLANQRAAAEHKIWLEQEAQRKAKEQIDEQKRALENQLTALRENLAELEADYTHTTAEKWSAHKQILQEEIAAIQKKLDLERALAAAARAPGGAGEQVAVLHDKAADSLGKDLGRTQGEAAKLGPNPDNPFEQMRKSITSLRQEWGTTAQQIGSSIKSVIGGAVQSVSQNLTAAISGTETWRQAFGRIGLAIEQSIIQAFVEMGVKYVATRLLMAAADKGIAAANVAALTPIALATSAVWAAPAALATIATFGGAAAAAPLEIAGAMLATQGLALASEGGYFPGDPAKARGIFHGDEFVFSAPAVRAIGPANLAAQHQAALRPASAGGGSSAASGGGGSARESARNIHLYLDKHAWLDAIANDVSGIAHQVFAKQARA